LDADGRPTDIGLAMAELPLHPRLARMVVGAVAAGRGGTACAVAALLEERDVLRGRPDEIETDVAARRRPLADRTARHPQAARLAAALDAADVEAVAAATGATVERVATLSWDPARDDLRARIERRLDNLMLGESEGPAEPGPAASAALVARVRATGLAVLGWSPAARSLQARATFARRTQLVDPERITHRKGGQTAQAPGGSAAPARATAAWPDVSDAGL